MLKKPYITDIRGIGELYEIKSVNRLRKRLLKIYSKGILFLFPSNNFCEKDFYSVERELKAGNRGLLETGFVDCPPWKSNPKEGVSPILRHKFLIYLSLFLISILVNFEFLWKKRGHIVYFLIR